MKKKLGYIRNLLELSHNRKKLFDSSKVSTRQERGTFQNRFSKSHLDLIEVV